MKLVFKKACSCLGGAFPLPIFDSIAPSTESPIAQVFIQFKCPICSNPWIEGVSVPDLDPKKYPKLSKFIKKLFEPDKINIKDLSN